jgi:hypothetical protein
MNTITYAELEIAYTAPGETLQLMQQRLSTEILYQIIIIYYRFGEIIFRI